MGGASGDRGGLVVIGSSAGGIEALSIVLEALPVDFPAPIVIAQHLDPRIQSNLATILAKHTGLRVVPVNDATALRAATVYVVPADLHVEISGDMMRVHDGSPDRPKPSIDLLFATAAEAYGDRLIAVVLTGLGSDGSAGARAVKLNGGTVLIEDPMTASFPSMPASLEPSMVDVIAPLRAIGKEIQHLTRETIDVPDDSPALGALIERVRAASGVDFSHYKPGTIKRRLARQMRTLGCRNIAEYSAYLAANPAQFSELIASFLIKVTGFFRDGEMFDVLRERIVPQLIEEARLRAGRELRVWSAGCATGEEAYSLAMLIADALGDAVDFPRVRIFGTDIDEAAIAFARRGVYPRDGVKSLDPELVARYFNETPGGYEIAKSIRAMTVFGQHDLGQRAPFPRIDLALCRNVLIYFSKELQARTLEVFAFSVRNGGYLVLGKSETTNPLAEYFAPVEQPLRIFRRYGERVTIPAATVQKPTYGARALERARAAFPAFSRDAFDSRRTLGEKLGEFLATSSIGVILVDRHYDIVSINASGRAMFDVHGVAIGEDFVHLTPPETSPRVRAMLDSALRNMQPTAGGEEIAINTDGPDDPRVLALSCYPELGDIEGEVTGAVILAVDVSESARARRESERTIRLQTQQIEALRRTEGHARDRVRVLIEANKELAQANSELRAQNDSLVINAEEAEAATEEIETLNEEMQATNEELETLNEEFQATIEELNTTNDEHEVRVRELEAQVEQHARHLRIAEARAAALTSLVDDVASALAAIDAQGGVIAANRRFRHIQDGAIESSVQIDDDAGATIPLGVVLRRAGDGSAFTFTYRAIAADQSTSEYHGTVRPLRDAGNARSIITLEPAAR